MPSRIETVGRKCALKREGPRELRSSGGPEEKLSKQQEDEREIGSGAKTSIEGIGDDCAIAVREKKGGHRGTKRGATCSRRKNSSNFERRAYKRGGRRA